MSRLLWSGAFLFASALAALAGDVAVFIGDSGNSRLARNAQAAVESAGFTVFATTSPRPGEIADMLAVAVERAGAGDRMVVYLGGATALAGTRSYHLGQARRGLNAFTVARMGTDIGIILDQMAEHPGRALLLLRTDRAPIVVGPDQRGIGRLLADVPAGVAAVEGSSSALLGNLMRLFDHPGASVSESFAGQRISGYAPEGLAFLDPADRPMAAGPAPGPSEEDIFFDLARTMGTSAAYRAYIDRYPAGKHVAEANRLIRVLRESPERRAQALEDGLGLSREARRDIQRDLNALGFDTRGIDGIFGKRSRTAIQGWQESRGLEKTGFLSGNQIVTLSSQAEARREEDRREDRLYWVQTGGGASEDGLLAYLERYPSGLYANEARSELEAINAARRAEKAAAEEAAWREARAADTPSSYRSFLRAYPDGSFSGTARARIRALNGGAGGGGGGGGGGGQRPGGAALAADRSQESDVLANPIARLLAERQLAQLGLNPGPMDGRFTDQTRRAVAAFQRSRNLPATGYIGRSTGVALLASLQ